MKTLILIRHAESGWQKNNQTDYERTITEQGKKDAQTIGEKINSKKVKPDLFLCSPAIRALSTAKEICDKIDFDFNRIRTEESFYLASSNTILEHLQSIDNGVNIVVFLGHNPGISEVISDLLDEYIDNMPTCGVVCLQFETNNWKDIDTSTGTFIFFDHPGS